MPHTKSQAKRLRQDEVRRLRNRSVKSRLRTLVKQTLLLTAQGNLKEAQAAYRTAASAIDKAAKRRIIHRNTAARRKARMARSLKKAQGADSGQ